MAIINLIMIKLRNFTKFTFARSRVRREIQFDPRFKDYTSHQDVKLQTEELRKKFEQMPTQTFTNLLNDPNPKLKTRFAVDKKSLNKKIRDTYKEQIKLSSLETHDDTDLDYLSASKSHLNDQTKQIEFEEQFKRQLFRTKETQRLLSKKQKQITNYIPGGQKDVKYLEYEEKKKALKNKKINNMMTINRNNQQLQLLIESGLFNDPNNIKLMVDEISAHKPDLLQSKKGHGQPATTTEIVQGSTQLKTIAETLTDIGPEYIKQRHKITQFVEKFESQHEKDKQSCIEDLNLLKQIKQYEQELFLSRYDSINFRFKGRVDFGFFKESQLVSYIRNENIEPKNLLLIFKQNEKSISRFKVPIMTPAVMGAIYSKTSLYKFPQTNHNNRLNMLNDPSFQAVERKTFKEITKLNDSDFCSVVWAFASNHKEEQGALRRKLYDKINSVVYEELCFRIYNLRDQDLGLVLRGMSKLHLNNGERNWGEIADYLGTRLPIVKNSYAIESIFQFLLCLPQGTRIFEVVEANIEAFNTFKWQQVNSIIAFTNVCGLLLKQAQYHNKSIEVKQKVKNIIVSQNQNICNILPSISINNLSQFLTVLRESEAGLSLPKTVNLCKKLTVDNIRQQKEPIKEYTLPNILGSFALLDLQKFQLSRRSKYDIQSNSELMSNSVRKLCLKSLLPFQPIPYNSSTFQVYHELATLTYSQMHNIPNIFLAKALDQLSTMKYKNERMQDEIVKKILDTLTTSKEKVLELASHQSEATITKVFTLIVNSYSFQKRNSEFFQEALENVLSRPYFDLLCKASPNMLIRFVTGVLSVSEINKMDAVMVAKLQKIMVKIIAPQIGSNALLEQELAAMAYCLVILGRNDLILSIVWPNLIEMKNPSAKFVMTFSLLLSKQVKVDENIEKAKIDWMAAEQEFYSEVNEQIAQNESNIGSPMPYKMIYSRLLEMFKEKYGKQQVKAKPWVIEVAQSKIAYFVATYDHLMARPPAQDTKQPVYILFGVWKLYEKYYEGKGWQLKPIISFLQGK